MIDDFAIRIYDWAMRQNSLHTIQRIALLISFLAMIGLLLTGASVFGGIQNGDGGDGIAAQGFVWAAFNRHIALISGHAGNDSGAVCEDNYGAATLTEADVVATVTQMAAQRLRRAGADVMILQEYDDRLAGLKADVLLSIHADSCIDATGYKAARGNNSQIPQSDDSLVACIDQAYALVTGLSHHPNSVTHNMTEYHIYKRIDPATPAAILEIGFLGGDQALLSGNPALVAKGVADSLLCFLRS
jgi:N-acetylmuramoyl-L-alanine amidase